MPENMNEANINETKKKSKALPIIIILIVVLLLAGGGAAAYMLMLSPAAKTGSQLKEADGYLEDGDYKKAISAYKKIIDVNHNCVEAYIGLASVYEAQAQDAMDEEEYEDALEYYDLSIKVLKNGVKATDDDEIADALDSMESAKKKAQKKADKAGVAVEPDIDVDPDIEVDPDIDIDIDVDPDPDVDVDPDIEVDPDIDDTAALLEEISEAKAGDIVVFGSYEQDGNKSNGQEPIAWYVLENKKGQAVLMSVYCLEGKAYHEYDEEITWEDCTLRSWLNDDFYYTAFNDGEMDAIVPVTLENNGHPLFGTEGGNDTVDNVYLLALEDFETYFGIPMNPDDNPMLNGEFVDWTEYAQYCYDQFNGIPAEPTQAAIDNKIWIMTSDQAVGYPDYAVGKSDWWVRNPGYKDSTYASAIYTSADVGTANYVVTDELVGVRPVITVSYK